MKKKGKVTYLGLQPLSEAQSTKQWSIVFGKNLVDQRQSKSPAPQPLNDADVLEGGEELEHMERERSEPD